MGWAHRIFMKMPLWVMKITHSSYCDNYFGLRMRFFRSSNSAIMPLMLSAHPSTVRPYGSGRFCLDILPALSHLSVWAIHCPVPPLPLSIPCYGFPIKVVIFEMALRSPKLYKEQATMSKLCVESYPSSLYKFEKSCFWHFVTNSGCGEGGPSPCLVQTPIRPRLVLYRKLHIC